MKAMPLYVGAAALVLAAFAALAVARGERAGEPAAAAQSARSNPDSVRLADGSDQSAMVKTEVLHAGPLPLTEPLAARLAYDEDATARVSAGFGGRIVRLLAAPGDTMKAGGPLAEIDSPDFGTAAADLAKARADEQRKRLAFERARDLLEGGVIARKDHEAAHADLMQAQAETARAEQRLHNLSAGRAGTGGERFMLVSPISGVVSERNANPAMEVNPNLAAPLFVVTDLTRLWLLIDLPERLLGKVSKGAHVAIESDAYPDERFEGTVTQIAQVVDPSTRRVTVRARVDNRALRLRPEMFVRASVLQSQGQAVRVPNTALVSDGLYTVAFVMTGPGEYRRRQVAVASRGGDHSFVTAGLVDGDRVVTQGALLLASELRAEAGSRP